jgi:hypothetical protein
MNGKVIFIVRYVSIHLIFTSFDASTRIFVARSSDISSRIRIYLIYVDLPNHFNASFLPGTASFAALDEYAADMRSVASTSKAARFCAGKGAVLDSEGADTFLVR